MCLDSNALETGALIKEYRKKKGLTQGELGEKVGVTASAIMRYEQGKRGLNLETINRIASALDVDPYCLMSFEMANKPFMDSVNASYRVTMALDQMTIEGKLKVADYAEDILPRYRAEPRQEAGGPTPAPSEGKDTTPAAPGAESPEDGG